MALLNDSGQSIFQTFPGHHQLVAHFVVVEAMVIKIRRTRTSKNLANMTKEAGYEASQIDMADMAAAPAPLHKRHLGGSLGEVCSEMFRVFRAIRQGRVACCMD